MSQKTHQKGSSIQNTSVDKGSYIFTNWISGGQLSPPLSLFTAHVILGTAASLMSVWATGTAGTGVFATGNFGSALDLPANAMYGFTHVGVASTFVNYQVGATVTVKLFYVSETFDW